MLVGRFEFGVQSGVGLAQSLPCGAQPGLGAGQGLFVSVDELSETGDLLRVVLDFTGADFDARPVGFVSPYLAAGLVALCAGEGDELFADDVLGPLVQGAGQ